MSHTRKLALSALLTLLIFGGAALSLHYLQAARAASGPSSLQTGQRKPSPANPMISKPVAPNAPTAIFNVTNTNDSGAGSLRQAMLDANAAPGGDIITFIVTGTINLASALPAIEQDLTITGPGANQLTVRRDTGGNYRIFQINVATTVSISGLTLTNGNVTGDGGGIHNSGNLTVTECAVTSNTATNVGGGILNLGTLIVLRSTFSGNTATSDGGGLWTSNGSATLTNCTLSGNTATTFTGGISNVSNGLASTLSLTHCTVANNNGPTEGGIATVDQGGGAATTLRNNIVANNSAPNLAVIGAMASVVSQGFNLSSDNSVALLNQMTDLNNTNPLLAALANNFGPTQTHALNTGSPALDKGNSFSVTNDQRGLPRLSDDSGITNAGDGADIGAFEAQPGPNGTAAADAFVVTRSGANIVVTQNAVQVFNQPRASTTSLTINGLGGNDTLTIDAAGGNPFPAGGILFDGGADADSITLQGGNFASGFSTPSGPSSGTLEYFGGTTGVAKLTYANLEPITDTNVVTDYTINGTFAVDTINMVNGPGGTIQVNSGTMPTFELINFSNKTNVFVNARAGSDTVNILARAGINDLTVSGNEGDDRLDASATTAGAGSIFLKGDEDNDTLIGGADDDEFDGGAGNDTFLGNGGTDNIGAGATDASGDTILVPGTSAGDTIALAISSGKLQVTINGTTTTYGNFIGGAIATSGIDLVSVNADAGNDTVTVNSTEATIPTNIATGADDDAIVFADGVSLNGGTIDGGANTDTLNYSAYTTPATVNLGLGSTGLSATLSGSQEVPPQTTAATGTVAVSNYNPVTKTFDIAVTVTDLAPADVTGFHLHRAPVGVNGPVIIDLQPLGPLTPAGTGFTFSASGVTLPAQHEAALLGGITYVNIHTAAAPAGLIRGQVFTNGNVNLATGTATGTSGISNVENVTGGQNGDSLVGNFSSNTLLGGPGGDTLVGGPGGDVLSGDAGADVLVWSNGDGSDVMDGGSESDTVQVNGNLAAGDVFTTAASGTRLAFNRTSSGPFSLDIGTVETLTVNGVGGDDSFTVNALTSATDLSLLQLFGFDGNDTFNLTPVPNGATRTIHAHGGAPTTAPGDVLDIVAAGVSDPLLTLSGGNGTFTATSHQTINLTSIENTSAPTAAATAANVVTGGATSYTFTVTYTGDTAINVGTLGNGDVNVTGPGAFNAAATFVSVDNNSNGSPRVATYSITPPGGSWNTADNGTYNVAMQTGQVADNLGNFVAAGDVGAFTVNIVAPIVVTTAADEQTVNGQCSLREALLNANANNQSGSTDCGTGGGSPDVINFSALFNTAQTITLTSGELVISDSLTINGTGANLLTVSGNNQSRVFNVNGGFTVSLSGITITSGNGVGLNSGFGGGILSLGSLTVSNCNVTGNTANEGGAIRTQGGVITVTDSTISGNTAQNGGGILTNAGSVNIVRSTVSGNTANFQGGGLNLQNGNSTLTNSTISGNNANSPTFSGGGVVFGSFGSSFTLQVTNCTIANNTTGTANTGGGIYTVGQGATASATTLLRNTIIANNSAPNLRTGAFSGGTAAITSQGFNLASDNGGGFLNQATDKINANPVLAPLANNGGPTLTHALLAGSAALDAGDNTGSGVTTDQRGAGFLRTVDLPNANAGDATDIGAFEAQSAPPPGILLNDVTVAEGNAGTSTATFNVTLSAASTQTVTVQFATADGTATAGSDYVAAGGTLTFNPGITSQPVNVTINGDTVVEPGETFFVNLTNPTNAVLVDAQGLGTILNDEPYIVTNANDADPGSLRQAMLDANTNSSGAQTILFEPVFFSTTRTINLASVLPNIACSMTINGPGANLLTVRRDTGGNYRIFTINSGRTVTLSGLTITEGNVTGSGGGIANGGTLTVTNCQIIGNTASIFGGGISNNGTLTVTGSTIANNSANGGSTSGGIDHASPLPLTLLNTTVSGNSATNAAGGNGGGLWTFGPATITNCTITNNLAAGSNSAGGVLRANGTTTILNSLIAANQNNSTVPDVLATDNTGITSTGFNLIGNVGTVTAFNQTGDQTGTGAAPLNPVLGALGNNGGPTQTHALLAGSPAINAGTATGAPATDQRGVSRPQGAAVDIGAFELIASPLIVTNTNDAGAGSLRQALLEANLNPGADTINFAALFNTAQTINLLTVLPDITDTLTLTGPGANLLTVRRATAAADFRVFNIADSLTGGVTISGLTISNGRAPAGEFGGGINSRSGLTLTNVAVADNQAGSGGGGISLSFADGVFTNCTLSGNTAQQGGGLYYQGDGGRTLRLTNVTVSGNSSTNPSGGGLRHVGTSGLSTLEVVNSLIVNNTVGDGLQTTAVNATANAITTLRNTIIANNTANNLSKSQFSGGTATVTSLGFNLASDGGGGFLNGTGDLLNTNPLLAALGNYGGPTLTHALLPGSPAINAGTNTGAPATDQRGIARPQQTTTDIGAFESRGFTLAVSSGSPQSAAVNAAFANPLVVTVSSANSEPVQGGLVAFTPPMSNANATLTGNPATIQANGQAGVTATANAMLGAYQVAATANGATGTATFNLTNTCQAITVNPSTPSLTAGTMGTPYTQTFTQIGGIGTPAWSNPGGGLPGGLTLNSSSGVLSGTPTGQGTFNFTILVTDGNGCTGQRAYSLVINPMACPTITVIPSNPALTAGTVGTAYSQTFTQTGGAGTITWSNPGGGLPGGLTLNSSTGALTGTPTTAATFTFTITATDTNNCTGERQYMLTINPAGNGLQFYPLSSPVRLLDTRANATIGCVKNTGPFVNNETRTQAARTACSTIPANATAIIGNITVVPSGPGFLTLFPSDATQPTVANSNFKAGEVTNNFFTVGLGATGPDAGAFKIFTSLFNGGTNSEVIIDVTGYYAPPGAGGLYYHPLPAPVRLLQTFPGQTGCFLNGSQQLIGQNDANANPALDLAVDGRGAGLPSPCNSIPADAVVLIGNATTVFPNAPLGFGYLTIYPSDATRPTVASSNYGNNDIINGPFAVKLGADGKFKVFTFSTTHLVIDISGYYSASPNDANGAGLLFNPLPTPMRLLETRNIPGFPLVGCYKPQAPIAGGVGGIRTQQVWGTCSDQPITIPNTSQAIVGNVTAINPVGAGFGTFFPGNVGIAPTVATTNYPFPVVFGYNRHYYVGLGPMDGTFKILTQFTSDYIVDVSGYFAP
jgi:CSLREA domain-containing protein